MHHKRSRIFQFPALPLGADDRVSTILQRRRSAEHLNLKNFLGEIWSVGHESLGVGNYLCCIVLAVYGIHEVS